MGDYIRIGIEARPLSQWLVNGLTEADLPVVCVETRHMKALLKAQQVNKSDRNDARGIAQMMRVGLFKPVHVKTLIAQEQRMLLTSRKLVQRKLMDIEFDMRGTLRNFGLKVGVVSSIRYEARIRDLVEGFPRLAAIIEPLLTVRRVMRQQLATLHKLLLNAVRVDPVCRRFMTVSGVRPVVALTYRASVDPFRRRLTQDQIDEFCRGFVIGEVAADFDRPPELCVQSLNGVRNRYEDGRCRRPAGIEAVPAYGATIRDRGTGSTKCGQADVFDELRARVSSWPPLRLARLRRERGSVGVVSPPAPVFKQTGGRGETCDRTGYPPHLRGGGGLGRGPTFPARPCGHDPHGARGLRQMLAAQRRGRRGGDRQRDGGRACALALCGSCGHRQSLAGEGDRARARQDGQD